jgi:hypothetical protein
LGDGCLLRVPAGFRHGRVFLPEAGQGPDGAAVAVCVTVVCGPMTLPGVGPHRCPLPIVGGSSAVHRRSGTVVCMRRLPPLVHTRHVVRARTHVLQVLVVLVVVVVLVIGAAL